LATTATIVVEKGQKFSFHALSRFNSRSFVLHGISFPPRWSLVFRRNHMIPSTDVLNPCNSPRNDVKPVQMLSRRRHIGAAG
jgi:hypothetical protein